MNLMIIMKVMTKIQSFIRPSNQQPLILSIDTLRMINVYFKMREAEYEREREYENDYECF